MALNARGIPTDARIFTLAKLSKVAPGGGHAHHDAVPVDDLIDLGQNLGLRLDPHFLVVDIDQPGWEKQADLPPTWTQKTPGGTHYLYRVPDGWRGFNQKVTVGTNGSTRHLADLKVNGYIVAPGSTVAADRGRPDGTYALIHPVDPAPAPEWLLALCATRSAEDVLEAYGGIERDIILDGENDNTLTNIAGGLRRQGFSERFIARALQAIGDDPSLMQQRPDWPYREHDYARIAHSIGRKPAGQPDVLVDFGLECAANLNFAEPPLEWLVHGFVPEAELIMLYGRGGIGKSTFGSWLAARVCTALHKGFLFVGVEEPFRRFAHRAILMGADPSRLYGFPRASGLRFPRDTAKVAALAREYRASVVYLDSVNTHFEAPQSMNAAQTARHCLGPLAEMAQLEGVTVIGAFHENKAGEYLGSVEMENVGRVLLHATRRPKGPLFVKVRKTNFERPDYALTFAGKRVPLVDPASGETLQEYDDAGHLRDRTITLIDRLADTPGEHVDIVDGDGTVGLDELAGKPGKSANATEHVTLPGGE